MTNPGPSLQDSLQSSLAGAKPAWQVLVEPAAVFAHPSEVLAASNLTREEKRAILASWASDAWAVESAPALRQCPGLIGCTVPLDDVLAALRALDPEESAPDNARAGRRPADGRWTGRIRWLTPRLPAKAR